MDSQKDKAVDSPKRSCSSQSDEEDFVKTTRESNDTKQCRLKRKHKVYWNVERDLFLLNIIEDVKPYMVRGSKATEKWGSIATDISKTFEIDVTDVGARNRLKFLLNNPDCLDTKNGYKSATNFQLATAMKKIEHLQQEVQKFSQMEGKNVLPDGTKSSEPDKDLQSENQAHNRLKSLESLTNQDSRNKLKRRRNTANSVDTLSSPWYEKLQLLEDGHHVNLEDQKANRELILKELHVRELELDLRRKELEHRKEIEIQDIRIRSQRFDLEKEERQAMIATQKMLMDLVMKQMK